MKAKPWFVYILLCNDNSFYTGIAIDVQSRFIVHQSGKGARYTKVRGAKKIIYTQKFSSRADASRRELEIKKLSRLKKELLVRAQ